MFRRLQAQACRRQCFGLQDFKACFGCKIQDPLLPSVSGRCIGCGRRVPGSRLFGAQPLPVRHPRSIRSCLLLGLQQKKKKKRLNLFHPSRADQISCDCPHLHGRNPNNPRQIWQQVGQGLHICQGNPASIPRVPPFPPQTLALPEGMANSGLCFFMTRSIGDLL